MLADHRRQRFPLTFVVLTVLPAVKMLLDIPLAYSIPLQVLRVTRLRDSSRPSQRYFG